MLSKLTKLFGFIGGKSTMRTKEAILAEYDASTNKMIDGARISLEVALDIRDSVAKRAVVFNLAPVNISQNEDKPFSTSRNYPDGIVAMKDGSTLNVAGGGMRKTGELTPPEKCEYGTVGCTGKGEKHACDHKCVDTIQRSRCDICGAGVDFE